MTIAKSCLEVAQVTCPPALPDERIRYCEFTLNIGIFFDGTDNNMKRDTPTLSQSNVARLALAYRDQPSEGFFRHYIPGVGTPFEELGTDGEDIREAAAGKGGEPRIIWGLLQILNSVHRFVNNERPMFNVKQMRALCSDHRVRRDKPRQWPKPTPSEADTILKALGLDSGLAGNEETRKKFLRECAARLGDQLRLRETSPGIAGIYLDIFGFSRGAAQARVFTNWLHHYFFSGNVLFGRPSYVRMLGLMDTVASVGFTNATGGEGHWDWATPENLRIHPKVKNCVHYVALHELRTVFPCESVCRHGGLPANCHEHYYPGAHSDVGGGYAPGFQGKAWKEDKQTGKPVPDDSRKLSQLSLNDMYQAARKTSEFHSLGRHPWLEVTAQPDTGTSPLIQQFALDPQVRTSVETYLAHCKIPNHLPIDQQLREHGLLYLTWRYMVTQQKLFERINSVCYARQLDADNLIYYQRGQAVFEAQIKKVAEGKSSVLYMAGSSLLDIIRPARLIERTKEIIVTIATFNPHAKQIYKHISRNKNMTPEVSLFYDRMVHDSYAGFIKKLGDEERRVLVEGEGYLRYRGVYLGDNTRQNTKADAPQRKAA